ncbi:putative chromatin structure-remodeling complex protein rsc7 protein [Phaeoacremonium minimum UCRPA7]|uniref:Putative chromatin structure-remodeling complex protein rsc7 protein n=1 Tax=Phaeoacremonium minimum (strain UCR-PA7) TaxID=1286976 RepID=R8BE79_PHAM7|nr:putative chromatin structure-remodeling complex protein rsc7 protein [Phaeoacremonium minimum UCRPA7]EON97580.1 putative chromatin structure-remodeling complex protein rsc7 protein [Phaeoacremonium minimum UCRPA7]
MAGRRSGRAAARRAAAALESTPKTWQALDDDDEPMPDAEPDTKDQPEPEEEAKDEDAEDEAEEEAGEEEESAKSPTPPPEPVIRRKRLGRPPKNKPPDWDLGIETPARDSDATPRKRGRGGWRGRGGRKGAPAPVTQQQIDKDGNMMDIINDEVDLPEDPEGETKVDKLGNLLGDREYRCRTFTVLGRGDRLYMLSTEPARCVGFRDSYLFFTKHRKLCKIIIDDDEKRDMIEREIIPHSYKGRSIGIVTARSVFREFGALIVVGGRRIIDDYDIARAKEEGAVEGELADPNDKFIPGEPYNKNQYVAWHGASAVYHTSAPAVPAQTGKVDVKKRRVAVNDVNWQLEHAREASLFNSQINAIRRQNQNGVYDIHTNTMQYPANMQPTHAQIVQVPPADPDSAEEPSSQVFPQLKPSVARNFMVTDTYLKTPPTGIAPATFEGPDVAIAAENNAMAGDFLAPFRGLSAISEEIKNELPPECRKAFDEALAQEKAWHKKWGTETEAKSRRTPTIDKAIVPYSMMQ